MPAPHVSTAFGDLLDPRFQDIFYEQYAQLPDMIPSLYSKPSDNGRADMRWSNIGALGDISPFTGSVSYDSLSQGYDTTATHLEFASGVQVERKLFDDDQYNIMDQRPKALATAVQRTRQGHAARLFVNAFANDTYFYNNTEGVALCSDSHTTTSGVATTVGFDNKVTSSLTAVGVAAARIQMVGYRDDRGNRFAVTPDEIWIPNALYEQAYEIVASRGKVDTANNNANVHEGAYEIHEWNYLSDSNDWFMCDSTNRKQMIGWVDRITPEFAFAEDLDTLLAKWRVYGRWSMAWWDWRFIIGAQVS